MIQRAEKEAGKPQNHAAQIICLFLIDTGVEISLTALHNNSGMISVWNTFFWLGELCEKFMMYVVEQGRVFQMPTVTLICLNCRDKQPFISNYM